FKFAGLRDRGIKSGKGHQKLNDKTTERRKNDFLGITPKGMKRIFRRSCFCRQLCAAVSAA
ncbi:hypothetical protein, partial [Parasutterella excrementihominis]|uniref:hypothetical protein n=1 Tax=Parasutterella excrementihominis TaxID=487175 RepID=UPI00272E2D4E